MTFKKEKTEEKKKEQERIYSIQELQDFDEEIRTYRIDAMMPDGRPVKYFSVGAEFSYLQDKGIVRSSKKITPEMRGMSQLPKDWMVAGKRKKDYDEHQNKRRQYRNWLGKIEFGQERRLDQLDLVAQNFSFPEL